MMSEESNIMEVHQYKTEWVHNPNNHWQAYQNVITTEPDIVVIDKSKFLSTAYVVRDVKEYIETVEEYTYLFGLIKGFSSKYKLTTVGRSEYYKNTLAAGNVFIFTKEPILEVESEQS